MIKNGKLFGFINVFDLAVIALIIALVAVGITKFKTLDEKVDYQSQQIIRYKIMVENVRDYTVDAYKSGDKVFDSLTGICIGNVVNVEASDSKMTDYLVNGEAVVAENPYKKDIVLTIETPGSYSDIGYFANKTIELKVGSEKKIETRYAMSTGKILAIEVMEPVAF